MVQSAGKQKKKDRPPSPPLPPPPNLRELCGICKGKSGSCAFHVNCVRSNSVSGVFFDRLSGARICKSRPCIRLYNQILKTCEYNRNSVLRLGPLVSPEFAAQLNPANIRVLGFLHAIERAPLNCPRLTPVFACLLLQELKTTLLGSPLRQQMGRGMIYYSFSCSQLATCVIAHVLARS